MVICDTDIVTMIIGTYPWSYVTQILHNGKHDQAKIITFKMMSSPLPIGTFHSGCCK